MRISDIKKPVLSGFVFFSTIVALSVGYGAYSSISSSEYAAGQSLSSSLFGKVVGNLENINARMLNFSFSGADVGIGTASPSDSLHVGGNDTGVTIFWTSRARLNLMTTNHNGWQIEVGDTIWNANAGDLSFVKSGIASRVVFTSSGNVGIGTTNPTNKLEVNGYVSGTRLIAGQNVIIAQNSIALGDGTNIAAGGQVRSIENESTPWLRFMNYAANVEWMRLNSGNLGIGTVSPVDRLHVKGDVSIEKSNGASRCRLTTYVTACSDGYASLGCTGGKCLCYYCY